MNKRKELRKILMFRFVGIVIVSHGFGKMCTRAARKDFQKKKKKWVH
jgi:hypothetical protein